MAVERKSVKLYAVTADKWYNGGIEVKFFELDAEESEKQYVIGPNNAVYTRRINKSAMQNGVWQDEWGSKFIGASKQAVIEGFINYQEKKIEEYESKISIANDFISKAQEL